MASMASQLCFVCNQPSKMKCSRCRSVSYCSTICQRSDWKTHKTNCVDIVLEIVNAIRTNVLETIKDNEDADPWDEKENGAGWLENEIGMACEFLVKLNPYPKYPKWSNYHSVEEFIEKLRELSSRDLTFIRRFIHLGGSGELFELCDKSVDEIKLWFNEN